MPGSACAAEADQKTHKSLQATSTVACIVLPKVIHNLIPGECAQVAETAGF
jgi:hypothetical protein